MNAIVFETRKKYISIYTLRVFTIWGSWVTELHGKKPELDDDGISKKEHFSHDFFH